MQTSRLLLLNSRPKVPPSFLDLFRNGEPGDIWLPRFTNYAFQDAAMTIPAVVGMPVLKIVGLVRGIVATLTNVTLQQNAAGLKYLLPATGSWQTPAIDFTGVGTMLLLMGLTKSSDAATAVAAELSATSSSNNGSFTLFAPDSAAATRYIFTSKGTVAANAIAASSYAAPVTNVVTGLGDIANDVAQVRVNGAVASTGADQGTGAYGNYVFNQFARNATGNRFNGPWYGTVLRGGAALPTAGQIAAAEGDMARLTGVSF
jgi:hypothetical protein